MKKIKKKKERKRNEKHESPPQLSNEEIHARERLTESPLRVNREIFIDPEDIPNSTKRFESY